MYPAQILLKVIEGQPIMINQESKVIILEIDKPFFKAGKLLNWELKYGSPGFGINKGIIDIIIKNKLKMLIRYDMANQREFWLNYDALRDFIKSNNTEYKVKSKWINVIPWKLFHGKPIFSGGNND